MRRHACAPISATHPLSHRSERGITMTRTRVRIRIGKQERGAHRSAVLVQDAGAMATQADTQACLISWVEGGTSQSHRPKPHDAFRIPRSRARSVLTQAQSYSGHPLPPALPMLSGGRETWLAHWSVFSHYFILWLHTASSSLLWPPNICGARLNHRCRWRIPSSTCPRISTRTLKRPIDHFIVTLPASAICCNVREDQWSRYLICDTALRDRVSIDNLDDKAILDMWGGVVRVQCWELLVKARGV